MVARWRENDEGKYICLRCSGEKHPRTYYFCTGSCQREWLEGAFDDASLREWLDSGQNGSLLCRRCMAMMEDNCKLNRLHKCFRCGSPKKLAEYSPVVLRVLLEDASRGHHVRKGLACEVCQFPPCAGKRCQNGNRSAVIPPCDNAFHDGKWYCNLVVSYLASAVVEPHA